MLLTANRAVQNSDEYGYEHANNIVNFISYIPFRHSQGRQYINCQTQGTY